MNATVTKLLNDQVNKEFYSAYLYLHFANYFAETGLSGFANWYTVQAQEERDHAMLFVKYLQNCGERVLLDAIAKPEASLLSGMHVLQAGLQHEQFVTQSINAIYEAAAAARDFRTMQFLEWFIKEQAEEETNATELIKKQTLFGAEARGLYLLDQQLGARVYGPPSLKL